MGQADLRRFAVFFRVTASPKKILTCAAKLRPSVRAILRRSSSRGEGS